MQPSLELRGLTGRIAQAVGDGDMAFLERHISRQADVAFLGTDPDEWWTDIAGLSGALAAQREAGVEASQATRSPLRRETWGGPLIGQFGFASATRRRRSGSAWSTGARTGTGRWSTFTARLGFPMRRHSGSNCLVKQNNSSLRPG
jgi:hypothetical protein